MVIAADRVVANEAVYAPFASRFRVAVGDSSVRLTWRDATSDVEVYRVYRHDEEITDETFAEATLVGTVAPGEETFVDTPGPGSHHYAVLAENEAGSVFRVFIPFRNKTIEPIRFAEETTPAEEEEETEAKVTGISAEREDDTVSVSFDAQPAEQELILFRSSKPIDSADSLGQATRIATTTVGEAPVTDYPVPGVNYYYGVFTSQSLEEGTPRFEAGVTVTDSPVEIPLTASRTTLPSFEASPRSPNPLPFLRLSREFEQGQRVLPRNPAGLIVSVPLDSSTNDSIDAVMESLPSSADDAVETAVLPEDRKPADKGPESALSSIVDGAIAREDWTEAEHLLDNLLSTPLPESVESRAHFYLGQTYYFTDRPRKAFFEFLLAEQDYYVATQPWIDTVLAEIES